jgi:hypothetical protein
VRIRDAWSRGRGMNTECAREGERDLEYGSRWELRRCVEGVVTCGAEEFGRLLRPGLRSRKSGAWERDFLRDPLLWSFRHRSPLPPPGRRGGLHNEEGGQSYSGSNGKTMRNRRVTA